MPGFTGVFTSAEARNIAGYVTRELAPALED